MYMYHNRHQARQDGMYIVNTFHVLLKYEHCRFCISIGQILCYMHLCMCQFLVIHAMSKTRGFKTDNVRSLLQKCKPVCQCQPTATCPICFTSASGMWPGR
eukprot:scpid104219/ scgid33250/ 